MCWVSDSSRVAPFFSQLMVGVGIPVALHSRVSSSPRGALRSEDWPDSRMVGWTGGAPSPRDVESNKVDIVCILRSYLMLTLNHKNAICNEMLQLLSLIGLTEDHVMPLINQYREWELLVFRFLLFLF